MLVEFTVSNYRSIHEPQTWSMVAAPALKEWEDRNTFPAPPPAKNMRLLRSAALYGPNAAGKSTLIQALGFMRNQVINSARESQQGDLIPVVPFKLTAAARAADSEFSAQFIESGVRYEYGFRCNAVRFTEEWLYAYPTSRAQKWFHRVYDPQTDKDAYAPFSEHFLGGQQRHVWARETRGNALFLSRCMQSNNTQLKPVF
ncbi:MAG TPA: AAA family ATPase, partial [Burkholderiaceae bacterium]|nr:AAA family ATPase [Burkholderiaceae bacterium]